MTISRGTNSPVVARTLKNKKKSKPREKKSVNQLRPKDIRSVYVSPPQKLMTLSNSPKSFVGFRAKAAKQEPE